LGFSGIDALNAVDFFLLGWAIASPGFVRSIAVATLFQILVGLGRAVFGGVAFATIGTLYKGSTCLCNMPISLTVEALDELAP
jgi:hypothetical protein